MPLREISIDNVTKITDFVAVKQPARVVTQTPAPGTPVLEGMTIQVHAISFSDVPLAVLAADAPAAVRNVSLADMDKIVSTDDDLKAWVATGTVTGTDFVQKFNSALARNGVTGTLSAGEATALVKSLNTLGFRG